MLGVALCVFPATAARAADPGKPLTLEEALAAADAPHPDVRLAEAERDAALADAAIAAARRDPLLSLEVGGRRVRPTFAPDSVNPAINDNSLRLSARKTLYDFGRTANTEEAARHEAESRVANVLSVRDEHRIEIMARFFDVLLADLQYATDNEFMAVAYVEFDHGRDRRRVGQISEVDLLDLEHRYQELLIKRNASQKRQRLTRALLANAMNQPGKLAADLAEPELAVKDRALPELEELQRAMPASNRKLLAEQEALAASRSRIEAVRSDRSPVMEVEMEAADYTRKLSGRDDLRVGVVLNIPLYQGDRIDARLARELAQLRKLEASVDNLKLDLQQALLETWLEIEYLQKTVIAATGRIAEFRDQALDRSRGRYEAELQTTLGDSMAATMDAKLRGRRAEYQLALAFARLEALLGKSLSVASGTHTKR